jgi:hypothetical protein
VLVDDRSADDTLALAKALGIKHAIQHDANRRAFLINAIRTTLSSTTRFWCKHTRSASGSPS